MSDWDGLDRLIAAEQDERRRLALFLHDGPVQQLSGIALMLDGALHSLGTGKLDDAREMLSTALARQRTTIRELRDLSFALEPVVLRDQGFGAGAARARRADRDVQPHPHRPVDRRRGAIGETARSRSTRSSASCSTRRSAAGRPPASR